MAPGTMIAKKPTRTYIGLNITNFKIKVMKHIKTVYIAGPITGKPNGNRKAFARAEEELFLMGYHPVNPHKLDHSQNSDDNWFLYLRVSIAAMLKCDAIVLLDGWEESEGANIEKNIAVNLDMPWAFMSNNPEFHYETAKP